MLPRTVHQAQAVHRHCSVRGGWLYPKALKASWKHDTTSKIDDEARCIAGAAEGLPKGNLQLCMRQHGATCAFAFCGAAAFVLAVADGFAAGTGAAAGAAEATTGLALLRSAGRWRQLAWCNIVIS